MKSAIDKNKCAICYCRRETASAVRPLNKEEYTDYAGGLFALWEADPERPSVIWMCMECRPGRAAKAIAPFGWWFRWNFRRPRNKRKRAVNRLRYGD